MITSMGVTHSEPYWFDTVFYYTGLTVWVIISLIIIRNFYICVKWATHDTRWALKHKLSNTKYHWFIGYWFSRFWGTLTDRLSGMTRVR